MLQQLPQLSMLHMPDIPFGDAAAQQAAAMTRLQDIFIMHVNPEAACDLQQLPSSLTQLQLQQQGHWQWGDSPSLPTDLPQLTGLLSLTMKYCGVPPQVLGTFTQLQTLRLYNCTLLPCVLFPGQERLSDTASTAGTAALLEALRELTCLQDLHLEENGLDNVSIPPQHFAALTASSQLTQLIVRQEAGACLPKGAVQHMFSPGRQMQALQRLAISKIDSQFATRDNWCIDSAGLLSITSSCPQLRHMDIACSVQPGADLSALLQLPQSCTSLRVGGKAFSDACMHLVLQLPQLQKLDWEGCPGLTDVGVEQLTALDLQSLFVEGPCGLSEEACPEDTNLKLESTPDLGSVSQQLSVLCDSSPVCTAPGAKRYRELLQAAAAREADLSGQLKAAADGEEDLRRRLWKLGEQLIVANDGQ